MCKNFCAWHSLMLGMSPDPFSSKGPGLRDKHIHILAHPHTCLHVFHFLRSSNIFSFPVLLWKQLSCIQRCFIGIFCALLFFANYHYNFSICLTFLFCLHHDNQEICLLLHNSELEFIFRYSQNFLLNFIRNHQKL